MQVFQATVGVPVEIPVVLGTLTGLTLSSIDDIRAADGLTVIDIEDDLDAEWAEVNSTQIPGLYVLTLIPRRVGETFIRITEGAHVVEFTLQSTLSVPPMVADPSLEADYTFTVKVGTTPIPDATVRVYDTNGTTLVTRGVTDIAGKVTFALGVGQYQVRVNKVGYDFTASNPTPITVLANDNVAPQLDEVLPATGSIGDPISLIGNFFSDADTEIVFGAEATVAADFVDARRRVAMVTVPPGLTAVAIPVRVRKPDPANPGQYLYSSAYTFVRV